MFKNDRLEFTRIIYELLISGIPFTFALKKISMMKKVTKVVCCAASEICYSIENGSSVPMAFTKCSYIQFDSVYCSFILTADKSGNVINTFKFLLLREEQNESQKNELISVCLYPVLIIIISFIGSILIMKYSEDFLCGLAQDFNRTIYKRNACLGFIKANLFLIFILFFGLFVISKLNEKKMKFCVLQALEFLIISGIDLLTSFEIILSIPNSKSKLYKSLVKARIELEKGCSISSALVFLDDAEGLSFEMIDYCADIKKILNGMTLLSQEKIKVLTKRVFIMIEPLSIIFAACYLIILLNSSVIPVLFNYGI